MTVHELMEKLIDLGMHDAEIEVETRGEGLSRLFGEFKANPANWVRVENGRVVIY